MLAVAKAILERYLIVGANDQAVARDSLVGVFGDRHLAIADCDRAEVHIHSCQLASVMPSNLSLGAGAHVELGNARSCYLVQVPIVGSARDMSVTNACSSNRRKPQCCHRMNRSTFGSRQIADSSSYDSTGTARRRTPADWCTADSASRCGSSWRWTLSRALLGTGMNRSCH